MINDSLGLCTLKDRIRTSDHHTRIALRVIVGACCATGASIKAPAFSKIAGKQVISLPELSTIHQHVVVMHVVRYYADSTTLFPLASMETASSS